MHTPTVLVVEADPAIRALLAEVLHGEGYQVTLLEPGALSVSSIAATNPDLLLLELMPGNAVPALSLIEEVQRGPAYADLPILVSTTDPCLSKQHRAAFQRLGCRTLLKPFDLDYLLAMVCQQLVA